MVQAAKRSRCDVWVTGQ